MTLSSLEQAQDSRDTADFGFATSVSTANRMLRESLNYAANQAKATPLFVQDMPLDLLSVLVRVDSSHPQIQSKLQEIAAATSGLSAAKQQRLPSLSIITTRSSQENSETYATTRLQQPLYAGGRITAGIEQSQARIQESQAALDLTRRDLMTRAAIAFHEVFKAKSRLAVAKKSVQAHALLLDSIGRRVAAEVSPSSDLMLTRSRLSQAQTEASQIELSLTRAQDVLNELIGGPLPDLEPPREPPFMIDLELALEQAQSYAPEIRQLLAQEQIALAEIDLQKSLGMPTVFVRHENLSGNRDSGLVRQQTYLGMEFTPGAGFSVSDQIKAAESRRLAAIEARRGAEKDVRERVRSIWSDAGSLRMQLQSIQNYVESAQAVSESFSRQFTIGRKTWVEVLNATREYLQAELSLADTEWNLKVAELRLRIETGDLTPEKIY